MANLFVLKLNHFTDEPEGRSEESVTQTFVDCFFSPGLLGNRAVQHAVLDMVDELVQSYPEAILKGLRSLFVSVRGPCNALLVVKCAGIALMECLDPAVEAPAPSALEASAELARFSEHVAGGSRRQVLAAVQALKALYEHSAAVARRHLEGIEPARLDRYAVVLHALLSYHFQVNSKGRSGRAREGSSIGKQLLEIFVSQVLQRQQHVSSATFASFGLLFERLSHDQFAAVVADALCSGFKKKVSPRPEPPSPSYAAPSSTSAATSSRCSAAA